mmetsp:Transcript_33157/g.88711  ORF Transcript_33157/g.88711 Transcript_33157/m.88711 type:complete len:390 (+) Transcript_33157:90-1259(+)
MARGSRQLGQAVLETCRHAHHHLEFTGGPAAQRPRGLPAAGPVGPVRVRPRGHQILRGPRLEAGALRQRPPQRGPGALSPAGFAGRWHRHAQAWRRRGPRPERGDFCEDVLCELPVPGGGRRHAMDAASSRVGAQGGLRGDVPDHGAHLQGARSGGWRGRRQGARRDPESRPPQRRAGPPCRWSPHRARRHRGHPGAAGTDSPGGSREFQWRLGQRPAPRREAIAGTRTGRDGEHAARGQTQGRDGSHCRPHRRGRQPGASSQEEKLGGFRVVRPRTSSAAALWRGGGGGAGRRGHASAGPVKQGAPGQDGAEGHGHGRLALVHRPDLEAAGLRRPPGGPSHLGHQRGVADRRPGRPAAGPLLGGVRGGPPRRGGYERSHLGFRDIRRP